jgi:hypothetical protein
VDREQLTLEPSTSPLSVWGPGPWPLFRPFIPKLRDLRKEMLREIADAATERILDRSRALRASEWRGVTNPAVEPSLLRLERAYRDKVGAGSRLIEQRHVLVLRTTLLARSFEAASELHASAHAEQILNVLDWSSLLGDGDSHSQTVRSRVERRLRLVVQSLCYLEAFRRRREQDHEWEAVVRRFGLLAALLELLECEHGATTSTRQERAETCGDGQGFDIDLAPKESRAGPRAPDEDRCLSLRWLERGVRP